MLLVFSLPLHIYLLIDAGLAFGGHRACHQYRFMDFHFCTGAPCCDSGSRHSDGKRIRLRSGFTSLQSAAASVFFTPASSAVTVFSWHVVLLYSLAMFSCYVFLLCSPTLSSCRVFLLSSLAVSSSCVVLLCHPTVFSCCVILLCYPQLRQ